MRLCSNYLYEEKYLTAKKKSRNFRTLLKKWKWRKNSQRRNHVCDFLLSMTMSHYFNKISLMILLTKYYSDVVYLCRQHLRNCEPIIRALVCEFSSCEFNPLSDSTDSDSVKCYNIRAVLKKKNDSDISLGLECRTRKC